MDVWILKAKITIAASIETPKRLINFALRDISRIIPPYFDI